MVMVSNLVTSFGVGEPALNTGSFTKNFQHGSYAQSGVRYKTSASNNLIHLAFNHITFCNKKCSPVVINCHFSAGIFEFTYKQ